VRDDATARACAFAPGHVTGLFAPSEAARDPRARGSVGAGVVLEAGVFATAVYAPSGPRRLRVGGDAGARYPISTDVARRLFSARNGTLSVRLTHQLPVGQGFGTSAAGAAATALAVGALFDRSREDALAVAHLADLFGGGGLGGVASIAGGGGVEFRVRAGLPPWGRVVRRPLRGSLLVGTVGPPLPTRAILRDASARARIALAAEELPELLRQPDAEAFFERSERFTDRARFAPPSLVRALRALRARGAWAAQAMFGRSFFARPRDPAGRRRVVAWLEASGLPAIEVRAARSGARTVAGGPPPPAPRAAPPRNRFNG
jgi:pantoate kinase